MDVGGWDSQVLEEDIGHLRVVVLPRVDDDVLHVVMATQSSSDGSELHELWAGADDAENLHGHTLWDVTLALDRRCKRTYGLRCRLHCYRRPVPVWGASGGPRPC